jgi:DNA-directed RNA polymerase subunit beta'
MAEISGIVRREEPKRAGQRSISITNPDTGESVSITIPFGSTMKVREGQYVEEGEELTEGALNPHDILRIKGPTAVQNYLIREVQRVYRQQGVDINDRHIEVIVRQIMRKVKVDDPGDTDILIGSFVDILDFEEENEKIRQRIEAGETELQPATGSIVLMGITKASLATESFLSAASFQETTRVLTEAAIKGKIDHLVGLKENVIIGKLVPAGTGMETYRSFKMILEPQQADADETFPEESGEIVSADADEEGGEGDADHRPGIVELGSPLNNVYRLSEGELMS